MAPCSLVRGVAASSRKVQHRSSSYIPTDIISALTVEADVSAETLVVACHEPVALGAKL
jgi:hypothetical protein